MRILLIAPYYDKKTPGESWSTFKWVEGISGRFDTTVLTTHKPQWESEGSPTAATEVVNWPDFNLPKFARRLDWELKPTYVLFYLRAKRWLRLAEQTGRQFDVVHQINPLALRYPSPAYRLKSPLIVGPLAGSLPTPVGFQSECRDRQWYRKLRRFDAVRLQNDPWLRGTYENASLVLGVAPYVETLLSSLRINRFDIEGETGVESLTSTHKVFPLDGGPLKLLFVGRIIRTKGVIDAIRAVGSLPDPRKVEFNIVGDGDTKIECESAVRRLGLSDIVRFHGRLPRDEVDQWYQKSHVFLFPSFREPSGNVVFEAMGKGLPVIGSSTGGPGYVIQGECGIRVTPTNPEKYAADLARAIMSFVNDPKLLPRLSQAAIERAANLGLWSEKIKRLANRYVQLHDSPKN